MTICIFYSDEEPVRDINPFEFNFTGHQSEILGIIKSENKQMFNLIMYFYRFSIPRN